MPRKRTDAERRIRQCERFSRLLRLLQMIMGSGCWDAEALARELECSPRTIHRMLQTLSLAGVPWFFDETKRAYRVRPGYRFKAVELGPEDAPDSMSPKAQRMAFLKAGRDIIREVDRFLTTMRLFCQNLEGDQKRQETTRKPS